MRFAGAAVLALTLALGLAPAAGAHDEADGGEITHRDTPAELAGADVTRTLARAQLTSRTSSALPEYLPTTWCGTRRTDDDTADASFPSTLAQIKVVYAYASDQTDRSAAWSNPLQADVSRIQQFLAVESGGRRALRFDMGTNCGAQFVDLQVVELPQSSAYYLDNFTRISNDVNSALGGRVPGRNVFVFADGLSGNGVYGIGEVYLDDPGDIGADDPGPSNPHNFGEMTGMMFVPPGTSANTSGWPTVMLHEITHNLGGVQLSAPHHTSFAHCTDGQDVMCYQDGSPEQGAYNANVCPSISGAITQTYDCGRDDYYDPAPGAGTYLATHWNVYNSAFMASCTQLGTACGGDIVPTPPVNAAAPAIVGTPRRGNVVVATLGSWLNAPSGYAVQWQRGANGGWSDIAGATGLAYAVVSADVNTALRVNVVATNDDGSAGATSAPTATVTDPYAKPPATERARTVRIQLRKGARRLGTLTAKVRSVTAGREVSTPATKLSLPAGTWRLKLCAGRPGGSTTCTTTSRVRSRMRGVRLPAAKVLVGSAGTLRVTAAALDAKRRIRARGTAASD